MKLNFEPTITWGHVMQAGTIIAAAGAIFVHQARIDARQDTELAAAARFAAEQNNRLERVEAATARNALAAADLREVVGRIDERTAYMSQAITRLERRAEPD